MIDWFNIEDRGSMIDWFNMDNGCIMIDWYNMENMLSMVDRFNMDNIIIDRLSMDNRYCVKDCAPIHESFLVS